jgi:geranylgeranyl diphosphate synthase type I
MTAVPEAIDRIRALVVPALQAAVDELDGDRVRLVAGYQLGWWDAAGQPIGGGGGKAIRPALAVLSAEAAGGTPRDGVPAAVAVELVHNFSLLHDDIMDRDVERRHRPTGWVAFGEGQAILAGNAMLIASMEVLVASAEGGRRTLPCLLRATQELISGQSRDLDLENRPSIGVDDVLSMEAGKTAALMECSASIGALAVGAPAAVVDGLAQYGHELGMAFQLVDDILGVTGDPAVTGKSSSSDVRAGKRSAPIVAALADDSAAARRLASMLADGPPVADEDVMLATKLIEEAGGLSWASREADARLEAALGYLDPLDLPPRVAADLVALAEHMVVRDH